MKLKSSDKNNRKKGLIKVLADTFKDFAKQTSLHGFKYIVSHHCSKYEKTFWTFMIVLSLCGAGYMTVLFWGRFTSNPTRTTIKTAYAPTTTVPFPGVTICNVNKISNSKLEKFISQLDASSNEIDIVRRNLIQVEDLQDIYHVYNATELSTVQDVLNENDFYDVRRVIRQISPNCDDLIRTCLWNKNVVPCRRYFQEEFVENGLCCSFNYVKERSRKIPLTNPLYGIKTGLIVIMHPNQDTPKEDRHNFVGVKVFLHSPEDYPGVHSTTKIVAAGRISFFQVSGSKRYCSEEVENLPIEHRHCAYSNELTLDYYEKYTDSNCFAVCTAKQTFEQCGCVPYFYDFTDKITCNFSMWPCLQQFRNIIEKCDCPSQCEDEYYDVISTSTSFETSVRNAWIHDYLKEINDTDNTTLLNIHFLGRTQRILLRDTMTSTIYLLASFGGVYSLFLGCSIISLVEILYYCSVRFLINIKFLRDLDSPEIKPAGQERIRAISRHRDVNHLSEGVDYFEPTMFVN